MVFVVLYNIYSDLVLYINFWYQNIIYMRTYPVLARLILAIFLVTIFMINDSVGQTCTTPTVFSWEGAFRGNKAVWKVDDVLNNYKNINGVDVEVKLIDPFGQNTNSSNPSEFNDYTKTNTFYGRGAFALQIKSQSHHQPVCLEFAFSKPIILQQFNLWDIDFMTNASGAEHSFQDSVTVNASLYGINVPVTIVPRVEDYSFRILGQSLVSNYISGEDGDLKHTDPKGSAILSTKSMISKFTICYENGPRDDGISNSQALKITDFTFCEVKGAVSGYVIDKNKISGIGDTRINLLTADGEPVLDKEGQPVFVTTDADGFYSFAELSIGDYIIQAVNKAGYESDSDIDGVNDDKVAIHLGVSDLDIKNLNFYDRQATVLPVRLVSWEAVKANGGIDVNWQVLSETNSDHYSIETSSDGVKYQMEGSVSSKAWSNTSALDYTYFIKNEIENDIYVRLSHVDLDGKISQFGIKKVRGNSTGFDVAISPNPTDRVLSINLRGANFAEIRIINLSGQMMSSSMIVEKSKDVLIDYLPVGEYFIQCQTIDNQIVTKKFVKM